MRNDGLETDRERILLNMLWRLVGDSIGTKLYCSDESETSAGSEVGLSGLRLLHRPARVGDLVVLTSIGAVNKWTLGYVVENHKVQGGECRCGGYLIRDVSSHDLCHYSNVGATVVHGMPKQFLLWGHQRWFRQWVEQAFHRLNPDDMQVRLSQVEFPQDMCRREAVIWLRGYFGGLGTFGGVRQVGVRMHYTKSLSQRAIIAHLKALGVWELGFLPPRLAFQWEYDEGVKEHSTWPNERLRLSVKAHPDGGMVGYRQVGDVLKHEGKRTGRYEDVCRTMERIYFEDMSFGGPPTVDTSAMMWERAFRKGNHNLILGPPSERDRGHYYTEEMR